MLRKVLSVVLFAAMLFSLVTVANAADEDTTALGAIASEPKVASGVACVVVYNAENMVAEFAEITAPDDVDGTSVGVMVPGLLDKYGVEYDNLITITGAYETMADNEFEVAIIFDGIIDFDGGDALALNGSYLSSSQIDEMIDVTVDGQNTILYTKYYLPKKDDVFNSSDYQLYFVQNGAARKFDFDFTVEYVDKALPSSAFAGDVDWDLFDLMGIEFVVVEEDVADDAVVVEETVVVDPTVDFEYANAVVTASRLNVRSQPSVDSSILLKLDNGDGVFVAGSEGNWYLIVDTDGDPVGYVFNKYISLL